MVLAGRRLYYTINAVAGLAIFLYVYHTTGSLLGSYSRTICCSFGYDQGMMGGVNTSPDYVRTMDLGYST